METLVIVARHRNQFYNRDMSLGSAEFGSSPSKGFRDLNCRAFESGMGLLPTPMMACVSSQSIEPLSSPKTSTPLPISSPKTPAPFVETTVNSRSENIKPLKKIVRSSPIQIKSSDGKKETRPSDSFSSSFELPGYSSLPVPNTRSKGGKKERVSGDSFFSERWAGPTYSNSPPPSCLPMPKFSMKSKRSISLELSPSETDFTLPTFASSAPASPTREILSCSPSSVLPDDESATRNLCRMLNLNF